MALITVGEIIDRSWQHYTKHFVALMSVSAWILIAAILNILSSTLYPNVGEIVPNLTLTQISGITLYLLTMLVIGPVISLWIFNMLLRIIDRQAKGKAISLKEIRKEGWTYFWPRILVGILVGLVFLLPLILVVPGVVLSVVSAVMGSNSLAVLSTLLLFIGIIGTMVVGIILSIRLFFSSFALIVDNQRGRTALKSSLALTKGKWWAVFFRLVIPKLLFFGGLFAIQIILLLVLRVVVLNLVGLNIMLGARLYTIGSTSIFIIVMTIINPLILIADYYLYQSVKKQ